jgi:hypothetical protein
MYNDLSPQTIDHINLILDDNRISNLRAVTGSDNIIKQRIRCDNKTRSKGIYQTKYNKKWCAAACLNGKRYFLGSFLYERRSCKFL